MKSLPFIFTGCCPLVPFNVTLFGPVLFANANVPELISFVFPPVSFPKFKNTFLLVASIVYFAPDAISRTPSIVMFCVWFTDTVLVIFTLKNVVVFVPVIYCKPFLPKNTVDELCLNAPLFVQLLFVMLIFPPPEINVPLVCIIKTPNVSFVVLL